MPSYLGRKGEARVRERAGYQERGKGGRIRVLAEGERLLIDKLSESVLEFVVNVLKISRGGFEGGANQRGGCKKGAGSREREKKVDFRRDCGETFLFRRWG